MLRNTPQRWGAMAQVFHWVSAALVLYLLGHGWWMTHFAARDTRLSEYATHASVGYFLLALILIRMIWRWTNDVPLHPASAPAWERRGERKEQPTGGFRNELEEAGGHRRARRAWGR